MSGDGGADVFVGPVEDPGRYRLDSSRPMARGGQGFVYRGTRQDDGRRVAVKQLTRIAVADWPRHRDRLRLVGPVDHPGLGRPLDAFLGTAPHAGEAPARDEFDIPYTVGDWIEGDTFARVGRDAPLPDLLRWVRDIAHAAAALHRQPTAAGVGIVHRDIKPSNVIVTPTGAVLVDLGIARPADGATGTVGAGSPGWIPREALLPTGVPDPASDVWQVAGLASWALLGEAPGAREPGTHRHRLHLVLRARGARSPRRLARHLDVALSANVRERPTDLRRWGDGLLDHLPRDGFARTSPPSRAAAVATVIGLAFLSGAPEPARHDSDRELVRAGNRHLVSVKLDHLQPLDTGDTVTATIELDPGLAPPGSRVRVQARHAGQTVRGAPALEVTVTGTPISYPFTAQADRPVSLDILRIEVTPGTGPEQRAIVEEVSLDLSFAPRVTRPESCLRYDATALSVHDRTVFEHNGARFKAGSATDATELLALAQLADELCTIGSTDADLPTAWYWRIHNRLLPPPTDSARLSSWECSMIYDPASLRLTRGGDGRGPWGLTTPTQDEPFLEFNSRDDAELALEVARHYNRLCAIGRGHPTVHYYWR